MGAVPTVPEAPGADWTANQGQRHPIFFILPAWTSIPFTMAMHAKHNAIVSSSILIFQSISVGICGCILPIMLNVILSCLKFCHCYHSHHDPLTHYSSLSLQFTINYKLLVFVCPMQCTF